MAYYRLYFMDGLTGHIERFHEFEADDDDSAVKHAEDLRSDNPTELWCHLRKVKRWGIGFD